MDGFNHLLHWKLKAGSHAFPGKDGGTCINEAALVAAGFEYQPVVTADSMPECFSRPICRFAMQLNDRVDDEERQHLLPYVARLACADTPEIETKRLSYIYWHTDGYSPLIPFERSLEILEGALAIGRQADPLGPEDVQSRMDTAQTRRGRAARPTLSAPDTPFLSKVKDWLTLKETEPAI
jgi:hypothetical protein